MEPYWKDRFRSEYFDLKDRTEKLKEMLAKYEDGSLEFVPTCPVSLLYEQLEVMRHYKLILEERAGIQDINIKEV